MVVKLLRGAINDFDLNKGNMISYVCKQTISELKTVIIIFGLLVSCCWTLHGNTKANKKFPITESRLYLY